MAELSALRRRVDRLIAQRDVAAGQLEDLEDEHSAARAVVTDHSEALPIVLGIAQDHRMGSLRRLEQSVTTALQAVYKRKYGFKLHQEDKRNQVETVPMVVALDGKPMRPKDSMGGGITDVVSLTLRPVLWSEQPDRSDPVIILDEPAGAVNSAAGLRRVSEVMRELAKVIGLQFIVATNRPGLAAAADRVFVFTNEDGFNTQVETLKSRAQIEDFFADVETLHGQA